MDEIDKIDSNLLLLLHRLTEGVRRVWVEDLVGPHDRNKIFSVRKVDDVVRISRQHVNCLNPVASDLKFDYFICADLSLLD